APIYLRDIAQLKDTLKDLESYARLDGKNVITLNIVKRPGENLIEAADKIKAIVAGMRTNQDLPPDLRIDFTGDQSKQTKTSFNDLINTIVIGFLLVLLVLMFFMGVTNAFFVALSVPLSVFVSFLFLPVADWFIGSTVTLNFIVLFALLFGLGIIVDDAIVVIENTHRIYQNGKIPIVRSAKEAAGEVWKPVLAGTLTTLAPFVPLLLWKGLVGKFMIYLPVMLILTLSASLVVAFIFNPVFAVSFMRPEVRAHERSAHLIFRQRWFWVMVSFGVLFHLAGWTGFANFLLLIPVLGILQAYLIRHAIDRFQHNLLPRLMDRYEQLLRWALKGRRPVALITLLFLLFPVSVTLVVMRGNGIQFFPKGDPNFI
ncbi:MAG: efflux RND transporter permease subunit, partial [Chitinophagaceae bacterium]